jgi:hypothetical protein
MSPKSANQIIKISKSPRTPKGIPIMDIQTDIWGLKQGYSFYFLYILKITHPYKYVLLFQVRSSFSIEIFYLVLKSAALNIAF